MKHVFNTHGYANNCPDEKIIPIALYCDHSLCKEGVLTLCRQRKEFHLAHHTAALDLANPTSLNSANAIIMICASCNSVALSMPNQMMESIRTRTPHARVIVFNNLANQRQKLILKQAGVHGIVENHVGVKSLAGMIVNLIKKSGSRGEVTVASLEEANPGAMLFDLSKKEVQILRVMSSGISNHEIGKQLLLTETTVKSYLHRIFNKMDAKTRTQAVMKAMKHSII